MGEGTRLDKTAMLRKLREKWSEIEVVLLDKNPLPSLRKQPTFATPIMTSERRAQKFHTDDVHHQDLSRASDWFGKFDAWRVVRVVQSEALLPRSV